ncbi:MAG: LysR family transcriptional regulator [Micropepsaceae bacterium]
MDRIDRLAIFCRVAETASFSRAADALGLPRSTVSTAIQTLEAGLGVRLLHRTTRRVALTEDGAAFYDRCQRLITDFDEIDALFHGEGQPQGRLRVNVPGRIGRLVIAPALPEFLARYPALEVDMGVTDRPVDLVQEGLDCAIRVGVLADSGLVARRLGDLAFGNYASPAYLARHGVPQRPEDLGAHHAVRYASPQSGRAEQWEYVPADGVARLVDVPARVTVNNAEAYIACALAGVGLIQIPVYDARAHVAAGELVEVMPDARAAPAPISLVYSHRRHLSRRLQVFASWIDALFRRDGVTVT